jgi:OOP family OmpA-OmpF porin
VLSGEGPLDGVGALLKKYPTYTVQVIGHTDNRGKHGELLALSLARAQSVFSALVSRGVDPKRLMVSGQGPDEPITDNKSAAGREQNNRVEVIILY